MKYDVHVSVEFVPLPVEHEPIWDEAWQILIRWMLEIEVEPPGEQTRTALEDD